MKVEDSILPQEYKWPGTEWKAKRECSQRRGKLKQPQTHNNLQSPITQSPVARWLYFTSQVSPARSNFIRSPLPRLAITC